MTCPTCARHKRDLDHAREILRRIHKGEPVDDGLRFWRGLLVGIPAGLVGWAAIFAIFRGVF